MGYEWIGGLISGGTSLIGSLINSAYADYRNRVVDQREDTAIQRRVADLKAAGLNPLLAAGQGAGSSTGMGINVDTNGLANGIQSAFNAKMNRESYKQMQLQTKMMENDYYTQMRDTWFDNKMLQAQTGIQFHNNEFVYGPFGTMKYPWVNRVNEANSETYERFMKSLSNQTDYDFNQSVFNLKTQDYRNGLDLTVDTLAPLLQLGGLMNPLSNIITATRGRRNYNYSNVNGNWNSTSHNYNYNYNSGR